MFTVENFHEKTLVTWKQGDMALLKLVDECIRRQNLTRNQFKSEFGTKEKEKWQKFPISLNGKKYNIVYVGESIYRDSCYFQQVGTKSVIRASNHWSGQECFEVASCLWFKDSTRRLKSNGMSVGVAQLRSFKNLTDELRAKETKKEVKRNLAKRAKLLNQPPRPSRGQPLKIKSNGESND
jgi:hypothetical protein